MSEPINPTTEDAIARGLALRAPHRADQDLLPSIMASVGTTSQVSRVGPFDMPVLVGRRRRWAWIAAAALVAVAIVAGLLISAGGNRPRLTVVPPSTATPNPTASLPFPTGSPPASFPVTALLPRSSQPCNGPTTQAVADGSHSVTSPMSEFAGIGRRGRLAYLTRSSAPDAPIELWAAIGGSKAINRIASFSGPGIDVARVLDWTPGAELVLVAIGHTSTERTNPDASGVEYTFATSCTDLYEVWQDGSGIRQITSNAGDVDVVSARYTRDDSYLAVTTVRRSDSLEPAGLQAALEATRSTDVVYRRVGDILTAPGSCGDPDWGSHGAVVACGPDAGGHPAGVAVLDGSSWRRIDAPADMSPAAAAWFPGQDRVIAISRNLESIDTLDVANGTWTVGSGARQDSGVSWTFDGDRAISPDRSLMIVSGTVVKLPSQQVIIDLHTGLPISPTIDRDLTGATWTLDGSGLVTRESRSLDLVRIRDGTLTHIGFVPDGPNVSMLSYAIEMP